MRLIPNQKTVIHRTTVAQLVNSYDDALRAGTPSRRIVDE
jgi:hypothetical protein